MEDEDAGHRDRASTLREPVSDSLVSQSETPRSQPALPAQGGSRDSDEGEAATLPPSDLNGYSVPLAAGDPARSGVAMTEPRVSPPQNNAGARAGFTISEAPTLETAFRPDEQNQHVTDEHPGRYLIARALRRQEVGQVSIAFDRHLQREVILKELHLGLQVKPKEAGPGPPATRTRAEMRFLTEARITARLSHPGVAPVHELGHRADGSLYFTSRLVKGRTLKNALQGQPLKRRMALLPHLLSAADTVGYAHAHGIVHRRLTPGHVVLGNFGETLVLGWGMARIRDENDVHGVALEEELAALIRRAQADSSGDTRDFSLAYLSPEHLRGEVGRLGAPSDVYCLGAFLYELLAGVPPRVATFPAEPAENVGRPLDPPARLEPECSSELATVALRALRTDPKRRYPDAREFAAAVRSWMLERIGATEPSPRVRSRTALLWFSAVLGSLLLLWLLALCWYRVR